MSESLLSCASLASQTERPPTTNSLQWTELVERIHRGDNSGLEELYRIFSRGIRFYLCRRLGPQELDDRVHDTFLVVVKAIQNGDLREPERLMGFVRTIVRRQVAAQIDQTVHQRREKVEIDGGLHVPAEGSDPEQSAMIRERIELAQEVLATISSRDREILTRFYLFEQSQEQICREMKLTETQFRLLKSRAKARFGELGKRRMARGGLASLFLRVSAASVH